MNAPSTFLPGSTLGIMGSGQLGRMLAIAARKLGYAVHVYSPDAGSPAGAVADLEVSADYGDVEAAERFAAGVDVVTFEFENIPVEFLERVGQRCAVRPAPAVLHICQHRLREKRFLEKAGLPLPRFEEVGSEADLVSAVERLGRPSVLKTAAFGYDGKGQAKIEAGTQLGDVWRTFEGRLAVLEEWVPHEKEISVLVARGVDGRMACFPVCENEHRHHILDVTMVPARIEPEIAAEAVRVAEAVGLVGLLGVEMFMLSGGRILINELAPRPHNSGHFSFDGCVTSQFEQQVRAVCGLPLGSTRVWQPVVMANLLGDVWAQGEPDWSAALSFPEVKLHLYGKHGARPGRKMGHLLAFGGDVEEARRRVLEARKALAPGLAE
jgi:5-(carboxyamino)imidazole ribonucleotide synthase